MSGVRRIAALIVLGLIVSFPVSVRAAECGSIDDLEWLLGRWESRSEKTITTESWSRISEDTVEVIGQSFAVANFNQTFLETIRVAALSGEIYYIAKVAHNDYPVPFKLNDCSSEVAVFENPDHDFPNTIAYHLVGEGQLRIDVSDTAGNGFSTSLNRTNTDRRIALTFDDAPRSDSQYMSGAERARLLIKNLAAVDSPPVIFFSTARGLDEEGDGRMRAYQQAGHYIGNHTYSHQRISAMGVEAYAADIGKAHDLLSQYENFVPLFRFPFLDEGRDVESRDRLREVLNELGYQNGYVTVDNYDFYMDSLLQRAVKNGRTINMDKLRDAYVSSLMESVRFGSDLADRHMNYAPAHTLLLHENDLAALFIGDLVKVLRFEGWTIIDARDAYDDPLADTVPDTLFNNQGRVAAIARANGATPRELVHRAEDTVFLEEYFEGHGAFGEPKPWMPGDSDLVFSSNRDGNSEIYLLPAGEDKWVNLSNHPSSDKHPAWSPDGKQITFTSWRTEEGEEPGKNHIYTMNSDGSGQRRMIEESSGISATVQWSPSGDRMIITRKTGEESSNLFLADAEGAVLKQLTDDDRFNGSPAFSPDGSKIAFHSDNQEKSAIDIMNTDGSQRRTIVSYGQSYYPHWSPDGCWLAFTAHVVPGEADDLLVRAVRTDGFSDWKTLVSAGSRESEGSWRPSKTSPQTRCN